MTSSRTATTNIIHHPLEGEQIGLFLDDGSTYRYATGADYLDHFLFWS